MTDLRGGVLSLLSHLPVHAGNAYPGEELPLPSLTVSEESAAVNAWAGGAPYLEESVFTVTVLAAGRAALESLSDAADAALTGAGFRREGRRDGWDEAARAYEKTLTYRAVYHGDTLYPS